MSVVNQFNSLGGKSVSRKHLKSLCEKALKEKNAGNKPAFEVYKRIEKLLNANPDIEVFKIQKIDNPIKEKLAEKVEKVVSGNTLVYIKGSQKLATVSENGTITYHRKNMPAGLRNEIRKDANIIGLSCPLNDSELHGIEFVENDDYDNDAEGLGSPVSQNDIYNYITDLILNTIKKVGHLPWQKEWTGSGSDSEAKNYVSKKPYTGINFILNFDLKYDENGNPYLIPAKFKNPYYLTFNQIKDAKATLKKDSKARRVIYYTIIYDFDKDGLKIKTSDKNKFSEFINQNNITEQDLKRFLSKIPVVKYYNVYRADDCTGLKFPPKSAKKTILPIHQAQKIIDGYNNPPKYIFNGSQAYYSPSKDLINMPKIEAFNKEEFYYSTFFHEIIHSTGSEKRLKRFSKEVTTKKDYAFEELIAELGAVYLCAESGILFTTKDNSAKYLKGWNKRLIDELENDNRFFFKAAAKAQKAVDLVLDKAEEKTIKKPVAKKTVTKQKRITTIKNPRTLKTAVIDKKKRKILKHNNPVEITPSEWKKSKIKPLKYGDLMSDGSKFLHFDHDGIASFDSEAFFQQFKSSIYKDEKGYYAYHYGKIYKTGENLYTKKDGALKPKLKKQITLGNPEPIIPIYTDNELNTKNQNSISTVKEPIQAIEIESIAEHQSLSKPKNRLMQMHFESLQMSDGWENLMQNPAANMKLAIWGPPKNGKTAGALKLADYLSRFGDVLYNFADQGFNKSTQDLWKESGLENNTNVEPSDISTLAELEQEIKTGKYRFVFIDMISDYIRKEKIKPEEFKERFIKQFPEVSFILIFEVTKGGNFKGDQGWTHLVDAIITIEDFFMQNRGRYGSGSFVVWEEGFAKYNPKGYADWLEENAPQTEPEKEELEINNELEKI